MEIEGPIVVVVTYPLRRFAGAIHINVFLGWQKTGRGLPRKYSFPPDPRIVLVDLQSPPFFEEICVIAITPIGRNNIPKLMDIFVSPVLQYVRVVFGVAVILVVCP